MNRSGKVTGVLLSDRKHLLSPSTRIFHSHKCIYKAHGKELWLLRSEFSEDATNTGPQSHMTILWNRLSEAKTYSAYIVMTEERQIETKWR